MRPAMNVKLSIHSAVFALVVCFSGAAAATTFPGNVSIQNSLCVGVDCADAEVFGFDTILLKAPTPQILFDDTSVGTFPANDWSIGIEANNDATESHFILRDVTANTEVLRLAPGVDGGMAIGANSALVAGALSVGAEGAERRIVHVADGVAPTDAVNLRQLQEVTPVLGDIEVLESRLEDLKARLDHLTSLLSN